MTQLTQQEKRLIALALFGLSMRQGPVIFDAIEHVLEVLELEAEFEDLAHDYVAWNERKKGS